MLKWTVPHKPSKFRRRIVGSDPRAATCRGKLQSKRSKLNMEINKEVMLRSGAEKLYRATTEKKTKDMVALELSFLNSNLQLLKEQLAELNSSVEVYQSTDLTMPMISLGLKETKELELNEVFQDLIESHYYEEGSDYEEAIAELMDLRQAVRTPTRDKQGISLLFKYYNQLYFVERRFFPADQSNGIYFEWFDALTGLPCVQKTVAFEKASILFNIGGVYTQIGTKQDRTSKEGLDSAVDNYLRAAGAFQYILENFNNAPSRDLEPDTLNLLVQLMCGQARECLLEKSELVEFSNVNKSVTGVRLEFGQEAAYVSQVYEDLLKQMIDSQVEVYIPFAWLSLIQVKREYYRALADHHVAVALLEHKQEHFDHQTEELISFLHDVSNQQDGEIKRPDFPRTTDQQKKLGKAHLREALLMHEEALRVNRMCKELRMKEILLEFLKRGHGISLERYEDIDVEDDFEEIIEPPPILAVTKFQLALSYPDFRQHQVSDFFHGLGPEDVFSAKHKWTKARSVLLTRTQENEGYGFSVRGDAPVIVVGVEQNSLADISGMREGDFVVGVGDMDVRWDTHNTVVRMIRESKQYLLLSLISPRSGKGLDKGKNSYHRKKVTNSVYLSDTASRSSSSGVTEYWGSLRNKSK